MANIEWVKSYVGIPYKPFGYTKEGCHCWGLVYLVEREVFKRWVPRHDTFSYNGPKDVRQAWDIIQDGLQSAITLQRCWTELPDMYEVNEGDIILLKLMGAPVHCGVAIDQKRMLHIQEGIESVVEKIWTPTWENRVWRVFRSME